MIELRLALSIGALEAMAHGEELVVDMKDEDIRLVLRCDDEALSSFQEQVQRALLHMLPVGPHKH